MTLTNPVATIHVWIDTIAAADLDQDTYYSVSTMDDNGDEIRCIGGSTSLRKARSIAKRHAKYYNVPCLEYLSE